MACPDASLIFVIIFIVFVPCVLYDQLVQWASGYLAIQRVSRRWIRRIFPHEGLNPFPHMSGLFKEKESSGDRAHTSRGLSINSFPEEPI